MNGLRMPLGVRLQPFECCDPRWRACAWFTSGCVPWWPSPATQRAGAHREVADGRVRQGDGTRDAGDPEQRGIDRWGPPLPLEQESLCVNVRGFRVVHPPDHDADGCGDALRPIGVPDPWVRNERDAPGVEVLALGSGNAERDLAVSAGEEAGLGLPEELPSLVLPEHPSWDVLWVLREIVERERPRAVDGQAPDALARRCAGSLASTRYFRSCPCLMAQESMAPRLARPAGDRRS